MLHCSWCRNNEYTTNKLAYLRIMTTATIHVFVLSCTQAKYELGILLEL